MDLAKTINKNKSKAIQHRPHKYLAYIRNLILFRIEERFRSSKRIWGFRNNIKINPMDLYFTTHTKLTKLALARALEHEHVLCLATHHRHSDGIGMATLMLVCMYGCVGITPYTNVSHVLSIVPSRSFSFILYIWCVGMATAVAITHWMSFVLRSLTTTSWRNEKKYIYTYCWMETRFQFSI